MRIVSVALLGILSFLLSASSSYGAQVSKPYQEFIDACVAGFTGSGGADEGIGKKICACTSTESKHQGVTVAELKKETTEIKKDPKYKIQNKKLLASFHYCTILEMEETEHAH